MLYASGGLLVVLVAFWVFCLFDVITSDATLVRNLPKPVWLLIVLLLSEIGGVLWLVAGRPQGAGRSLPYKGNAGVPPEYDRPGRAVATNPDDDEAFLEGLRRRAEEQRRKAAEEARRRGEDEGGSPA